MNPERWHQIDDLLSAALEREAEQRAAFLAKECAGDEELKRQVELLLREHGHLGTFLEDTPVGTGLGDASGSITGLRIGSYRLLDKIGQGGMGSVYLAERADGEYRKRVALKIIKRGMDTDAILGRFRRERQILASLQHPNIAMLLDGGTSEDGLPYFVMEYVRGQQLLDYCDSRSRSVRERLTLFRTICSAVQHAHQNQVVHRDLKPGNILVNAEGIPKLVDFGIAKVLDADFDFGMSEPTGMGVRPMTPAYASPEQVLGKPITAASDIYSLGVLLYQLLSGLLPSVDPREIEARFISQAEPLKPSLAVAEAEQVRGGDKPPQAARAADRIGSSRGTTSAELRRQLTGDLDTIVLKAMHVEPERRYTSAQELSEDLQRCLAGLPIEARRDATLYRAGRYLRRHKASVLFASFVSVAVLAVVGIALVLRRPDPSSSSERIRSIAVLPLKNLSSDPEQEYFSEGVTGELIARLASLEGLRVISHTSVRQYKDPRKPLPAIAKDLNVDAIVEGSVLRAGERVRVSAELIEAAADRHIWAETYERNLGDILALQNEVTREIARNIKLNLNPADRQRLTVSRRVDAEAHADYLRGRFHWATRRVPSLKSAVRYFEQAIASDPSYANAYAGLADSLTMLAAYSLAPQSEFVPRARAAALKALEIDEGLAEAHTSLAVIAQNYDWDWQTAERRYRRAIQLDPNYATAHHWYGEYLSFFGRFDEAFAELERARQLDPLSLIIASDKAVTLYFSRQYDLAIEQFRAVLDTEPFFPRAATVVLPYVEKRRFADALDLLERWRRIDESPWNLMMFTYLHGRAGQLAEARRALQRLEELTRHQHIDPTPIAIAHIYVGDTDQAFAWFEKAYLEHSPNLTGLKVSPIYDPLRGDPRFQDLLRRVGLGK